MELKGVGYGSTISSFREQCFSRFDYDTLAVSCAFFVLSLAINAYSKEPHVTLLFHANQESLYVLKFTDVTYTYPFAGKQTMDQSS